ncbi:conserved hypothetical protein [Xenorhabdus bovienii str. puntauvense]|uniref:Uncharacterized protein n=1 Tax=Xenorhabdus bovienii str. puntauvense TaxID=1398201 RepID=A0A077N800_XENBV|nr:hypothetical protein [Xenorhabdus bovienii]CDG98351.1 conserved hypothetical protein [Xenorhabdus bovienii str. puntauvense]
MDNINGTILADITAATSSGLPDISRISQGMAMSVMAFPKIETPFKASNPLI